jgi:hypothetical protein
MIDRYLSKAWPLRRSVVDGQGWLADALSFRDIDAHSICMIAERS